MFQFLFIFENRVFQFIYSHRCEWDGNQKLCKQRKNRNRDGTQMKAKKSCCPCKWGHKVARSECLVRIQALCVGVCMHIERWNWNVALVLSYCFHTHMYFSFHLYLTSVELVEQMRSWVYLFISFLWKQWMQVVWMHVQTGILGLSGAVHVVVTVLV